jgi:hypothetical protein
MEERAQEIRATEKEKSDEVSAIKCAALRATLKLTRIAQGVA